MTKDIQYYFFKYPAIFIIVFLIFTVRLNAQENIKITLEKANSEYAKGNYQNAIGLYKQIEDAGYEAPGLYYNLGNAWFKTNNYPSAILYYEKAKRLDPSDEDIEFNIKVANSKIIDKIDIVPELFYNRWWKTIYSLTTSYGWAVFSILSLTLFLLLIGLYLFSGKMQIRKFCFYFSFLFLITTLLALDFAFIQQKIVANSNEAIIFTPVVSVKSSPDANSIDLFVIHEGTKVEITDNIGDWSEIRIANKSKGWIKKDNYQKI
jgi:tetratricopeptide (TPR) repeat protein